MCGFFHLIDKTVKIYTDFFHIKIDNLRLIYYNKYKEFKGEFLMDKVTKFLDDISKFLDKVNHVICRLVIVALLVRFIVWLVNK